MRQDFAFFRPIDADEFYFGLRRVGGKRGSGASGKNIVFGLLKRSCVYTEIVPNAAKATLQAIIRSEATVEKRNPYQRLARL